MRRYYTLVEFHDHRLTPRHQGGRGLQTFRADANMELYRDMDAPDTLVAVSADRELEYPWSAVKHAVRKSEPKKAKP